MTIRNETKIGLLTIVALGLLVFGYSVISGSQIFSSNNHYYARYEQINGLEVSHPVMLKGYQIGKVKEINILEPKESGLMVRFTADKEIKIPKGSKAEIYRSSLLGSKAIQLLMEDKSEGFLKPGDTLKGKNLSLAESLRNQFSNSDNKNNSGIVSRVDTMIKTINDIFQEGGKKDLQESLKDFRQSIASLNRSTKSIDTIISKEKGNFQRILDNTATLTENLKANTKEIDNTLKNLSSVSDSLAKADIKQTLTKTDSIASRLNRVIKKINKGQGTAAKLVNNDSLYRNLESTSKALDRLVKDLNENPGRYLNFSIINFRNNKGKEE